MTRISVTSNTPIGTHSSLSGEGGQVASGDLRHCTVRSRKYCGSGPGRYERVTVLKFANSRTNRHVSAELLAQNPSGTRTRDERYEIKIKNTRIRSAAIAFRMETTETGVPNTYGLRNSRRTRVCPVCSGENTISIDRKCFSTRGRRAAADSIYFRLSGLNHTKRCTSFVCSGFRFYPGTRAGFGVVGCGPPGAPTIFAMFKLGYTGQIYLIRIRNYY